VRVVSLFSGVGGFDLGLERAGMTTVAQVEWDAKCQQVLARHWPDVPRWGDVSDVNGADLPDCDLVAFGSPCQDLSVAGKRAGMVEGETRSGLFYEAIRIIEELQHVGRGPAWVVWENVVGALSSNRGLDFAAVIDSVAGLGAVDIQWRVLDAQWFGVAQRRRRVFVVARLDPGAAGGPQVLPVGASVRRNPPTGGEAGQEVAGTLGRGSGNRGWAPDTDRMTFVAAAAVPEITGTVMTTWAKGPGNTQVDEGHVIAVRESGKGYWMQDQLAGPLRAEQGGVPSQVVAFGWQENRLAGNVYHDEIPGLTTSKTYAVASPSETQEGLLAVRRLTPRECERLMGWPDDWTAEGVDTDGNPVTIADSTRYRMIGNGVASPVAEWIGRHIIAAEVTP
jgi:DNA (cytosine-5)-methyltransferase 1